MSLVLSLKEGGLLVKLYVMKTGNGLPSAINIETNDMMSPASGSEKEKCFTLVLLYRFSEMFFDWVITGGELSITVTIT